MREGHGRAGDLGRWPTCEEPGRNAIPSTVSKTDSKTESRIAEMSAGCASPRVDERVRLAAGVGEAREGPSAMVIDRRALRAPRCTPASAEVRPRR